MIRLDQPSFGRAPVRTVLSARQWECLRLPKSTRRTIGHDQNTFSMRADSDRSDGLVADDVLFRQEPDEEEEDEDEGDGKDDDDDRDDDGYSE